MSSIINGTSSTKSEQQPMDIGNRSFTESVQPPSHKSQDFTQCNYSLVVHFLFQYCTHVSKYHYWQCDMHTSSIDTFKWQKATGYIDSSIEG